MFGVCYLNWVVQLSVMKKNKSFKISLESILVLAQCLWELILVKFFTAITQMKNGNRS